MSPPPPSPPDLVIAHLYPDLLRTYGDRGNLLVLARRAEWRGWSVRCLPVPRGARLPGHADIVLIGGGTDTNQLALAPDLALRASELHDAVDRGTVVVGVCGGYQLLGEEYVASDGTPMRGLGLLDVTTRAGTPRLVGRVRAEAALWGTTFELAGFENHAGRTTVGSGAAALARVAMGGGNGDGTEGAVQGNVVGTYLHGPVLALNPRLADAILGRAVGARTGGRPLPPLGDRLEQEAHDRALELPR